MAPDTPGKTYGRRSDTVTGISNEPLTSGGVGKSPRTSKNASVIGSSLPGISTVFSSRTRTVLGSNTSVTTSDSPTAELSRVESAPGTINAEKKKKKSKKPPYTTAQGQKSTKRPEPLKDNSRVRYRYFASRSYLSDSDGEDDELWLGRRSRLPNVPSEEGSEGAKGKDQESASARASGAGRVSTTKKGSILSPRSNAPNPSSSSRPAGSGPSGSAAAAASSIAPRYVFLTPSTSKVPTLPTYTRHTDLDRLLSSFYSSSPFLRAPQSELGSSRLINNPPASNPGGVEPRSRPTGSQPQVDCRVQPPNAQPSPVQSSTFASTLAANAAPPSQNHPQPQLLPPTRPPRSEPFPLTFSPPRPPIEVDHAKYDIPELSSDDEEVPLPQLSQLIVEARGNPKTEAKDGKREGKEDDEQMEMDQVGDEDEEEEVDQLVEDDENGIEVEAGKGGDLDEEMDYDPDDMYVQDALTSTNFHSSDPPEVKDTGKKREREPEAVDPSTSTAAIPTPPTKRAKVDSTSMPTSKPTSTATPSTPQRKPRPRSKPQSSGSTAPPPSTAPAAQSISTANMNSNLVSNASSNSLSTHKKQSSSSSIINYTKHPEFWQLDGTIQIQVGNVRFKLTRSRMVMMSGLIGDAIHPGSKNRGSDKGGSKANSMGRANGVRVVGEDGTIPVVHLDENKIVSLSDFEVWVRAVEDTFSYLASEPSLFTTYALHRASTALRSPSPLSYTTKVISDVWSADSKRLTAKRLTGAAEVLALARRSLEGSEGGEAMQGVMKRAMYELLRHETFEQHGNTDDGDSEEDEREVFFVHGSSEDEYEKPVTKESTKRKGLKNGDTRKWELATKDVMLLMSARSKLQRRWVKDTGAYPGELLPCRGSPSSTLASSSRGKAAQAASPSSSSSLFASSSPRVSPSSSTSGSTVCPGMNPTHAQEVFRNLLLNAPPTPFITGTHNDNEDEDTVDLVEAYMDDVVCGYTALLSLPWDDPQRAGFCQDCVDRQKKMWGGTRERVWRDCEVLLRLRK